MFLNGLRATEWSRRQAGVGRCQMPKSNVGCFPCRTVRSQRATGIGRLMVNVVEGIELKPCRSHGKAPRSPL